MNKNYDIAAYVWPAYTGESSTTRIFWEKGIGEWQTVLASEARFEGQVWPRRPLWGCVNEANPDVMEMQIKSAVNHGVNVFIYDWYWYDNRPFLNECLENGFLKADNNEDMKFFIMWANHDVRYTWDVRNADKNDSMKPVLYRGAVTPEEFENATDYVIENYFSKPNYYKIDGKPVFQFYFLPNLMRSFGSVEKVAEALEKFRAKTVAAGYPGLHLQLDMMENGKLSYKTDSKYAEKDPVIFTDDYFAVAEKTGFDSITHYQFVDMVDVNTTYEEVIPEVLKCWEETKERTKLTYYPHVSVGRDANPRYKNEQPEGVLRENTPEQIEKMFRLAKEYADKNSLSLITVNSWNEWTEGSYLQPDDLYGYGYLEAIKKVFK